MSIIIKCALLCCLLILTGKMAHTQYEKSLFKMFPANAATTNPIRFYELLCTKKGTVFSSSTVGLIESAGIMKFYPAYLSVDEETKNLSRSPKAEDSIKSFCEGIGNCIFFVSHDNKIIWFPYDRKVEAWIPSFDFPDKQLPGITISKIWSDSEGTLFIGTGKSSFYVVKHGANQKNFPFKRDELISLSEKTETRKLLPVKKIITEDNTGVFCFSEDPLNTNIVFVGTNKGLYRYNKLNNKCIKVLCKEPASESSVTLTTIEANRNGNIWFSTLEQGMGVYDQQSKTCRYFHYNKKQQEYKIIFEIKPAVRQIAYFHS